jgi:hypothetical protein
VSLSVPAMTPTRHLTGLSGELRACASIAVVVALAAPVVAMLAGRTAGAPTWTTTSLAGFVCWFSASLSLVVAHRCQLRGSAMVGVFAGMLIRMSIPLAVGVAVTAHGGALAREGLFGQLLIFFLLTLVVETWLSLALARATLASTTLAQRAANSAAKSPMSAAESAGGPRA